MSSVRNVVLTQEGLNAVMAAPIGAKFFINYFQPIYDHRLDPNVHSINANPQTDVSAFSACDDVSTTVANIFGEQIYNSLTGSYELSQYEALHVSATLGVDNADVSTISYTTYGGESQSDTSRVNLYNGLPLSNILSANSNDIIWDATLVGGKGFSCPNDDGHFRLATSVGTLPGQHSRYFPVQSYTPITSGSGEVRGLYKCVLGSSTGNFKFNKVALYVSQLSADGSGNYSLDAEEDPVLLAVCYLTSPVYKAKTQLELTNYELNVELRILSTDTAVSAISFYPNTDWARVPPSMDSNLNEVPSLHWDGYVGIRTYVNASETPQRPLHIIDSDQPQIRLGYNTGIYNELQVNYVGQLEYFGNAIVPSYNNSVLGWAAGPAQAGRWANIYGNHINLANMAGPSFLMHKLKTSYSYPEFNLIFESDFPGTPESGRFVNGDFIRRDTRGMMLVTEMPTANSDSYAASGDSIMLIAGYSKFDWQNTDTYDYHDSLFSKFYNNDGLDGMSLLNNWEVPHLGKTQIRLFSPGNIRFTNTNGVFELCRYFRTTMTSINAISKWSININANGSTAGDLLIRRNFDENGSAAIPNIVFGGNILPENATFDCGSSTNHWYNMYTYKLRVREISTNHPSGYLFLNKPMTILPQDDGECNLGIWTNYFNNIYGANVWTNQLSPFGGSSTINCFGSLIPGYTAIVGNTGEGSDLGSTTKYFKNIYAVGFPDGIRSGDLTGSGLKWKILEGTFASIANVSLQLPMTTIVVGIHTLVKKTTSDYYYPSGESSYDIFLGPYPQGTETLWHVSFENYGTIVATGSIYKIVVFYK